MKHTHSLLVILMSCCISIGFANPTKNWTEGFTVGNPNIQSINAMAFGPEGILFIGDSKHATIFAMETSEEVVTSSESIEMKQIDKTLAGLLGTTADQVSIQDMAVHPVSKSVYIAIHLGDGQPVLMKTTGEAFEQVALEEVNFSQIALSNPVGPEAKDRRGRSLRKWAISDLSFYQDQLMVSGLSNEEFSSTFRSIPFPFTKDQTYASLEIYHAAHGRYETYAPIKTFLPYELNGQPHLIASYTCTPLVIVPIEELQGGEHTKGRTVAELGNRNTPLDIISYEKEDEIFILLANSSRALMKIDPSKISAYKDYLKDPVKENSGTAGVEFLSMPYVNVQQLDDYNQQFVIAIQRKANGSLDLSTISKNRL